MSASTARTTEVSAHDDCGFWTVRAFGVAGEWFACSSSLETASSLAVYASLIGESPKREWDYTECEDSTPYTLSTCESESVAEYKRLEGVWKAYCRGTLLTQAPLVEDDGVNARDYAILDRGGIVPLSGPLALILDGTSYVRMIREGMTYTDVDGCLYSYNPAKR